MYTRRHANRANSQADGKIISRPVGAPSQYPDDVLEALYRRQSQLSWVRGDVCRSRVQLDYERQKCHENRRHLQNSMQMVMDETEKSTTESSTSWPSTDTLSRLRVQVMADIHMLGEQQRHTRAMEWDLSDLENSQKKYEARLIRCISHALAQIHRSYRTGLQHVPPIDTSHAFHSSDSSTQTADFAPLDPLIERLCERQGAIEMLEEQLSDLDGEQREELLTQAFREDQSLPPTASGARFLNTYRSKRDAIEQQLNDCLTEAENLRRECVHRGLDLDYSRIRPEGNHDPSLYDVLGHDQISALTYSHQILKDSDSVRISDDGRLRYRASSIISKDLDHANPTVSGLIDDVSASSPPRQEETRKQLINVWKSQLLLCPPNAPLESSINDDLDDLETAFEPSEDERLHDETTFESDESMSNEPQPSKDLGDKDT